MKNIANQYRQEKKDIQNKFIQYDLTEQQKQELTKFENHIAFVAEKDTAINKCNSLAEKIIAITDPHTINNNCENEEAAKKEAYKMIKNEPLNMIEYLLNIIEENDITLG